MKKPNKALILLVQIVIIVLIVMITSTLISMNFFQSIDVIGESMLPSLHTGDKLYLQSTAYKIAVNDIICFYRPENFNEDTNSFGPYDEESNPALKKHSINTFFRSIPFLGKLKTSDESGEQESSWKLLVKRIIGLPGDTIELKSVYEDKEYRIYVYRNNERVEESFTMYDSDYYPYEVLKKLQTNVRSRAAVTLGDDEYYVMGDNRGNSIDSEDFGPIKAAWIWGKVIATNVQGKFSFGS